MGIKYKNGNAYSTVCPYAVGDVYLTFSATSPATRWPGTTWTLVTAGTFLVAGASSGTYKVGSTGGEASHRLTINEMPAHAHTTNSYYGTNGVNAPVMIGVNQEKDDAGPLSTKSAGGNAAHNNMPPYIACYMWRRTGGVSQCSDAVEGGAACLASTSANSRSRKAPTGATSALGGSGTCSSRQPARIQPPNGQERAGRSTRRTGSLSAQARRTLSGLPEGLLPSRCRQMHCRKSTCNRNSGTTAAGQALGGFRANTATSNGIIRTFGYPEGTSPMRTVLRTSPLTYGGAFRRKAVA